MNRNHRVINGKKVVDDWDEVISTSYKVVEEQLGRGTDFIHTLAQTLQVAGLYEAFQRFKNYAKSAMK